MQQNQYIVKIVFSIFLAIGFLLPWEPSNVLAASCYGEGNSSQPTCTGLYAGPVGCTATNSSDPNYWTYNGAKIERRSSTICNAKWTRITNVSGSTRYTAGSTNYGCSNYCYHQSVQSSGAISNGSQVYTPMKGLTATPVLSCGATSASAMTLPIKSPAPNYTGCRAW